MGVVEEIETLVKEYLAGDYAIIPHKGVPTIDNVHFGKRALKCKLTTFSIDLRKSSQLLFDHHKQTAGKIHKAFLTAIVKVIKHYGGEIRDFQGDSVLAFWPGDLQSQVSNAVRAAFAVKWILTEKLKSHFGKYTQLDFGIGIDWGEIYVFRAGIKRNVNNNDLVYIGKSLNFAVAMANQAKSKYNIYLSANIYSNLTEEVRFSKQNNEDRFKDCSVIWNESTYNIKKSSYWWGI